MSEEINTSSLQTASKSLSWYQVWWRATVHPSVATFEELLQDPKASVWRAYAWAFLTALIAYLVLPIILLAQSSVLTAKPGIVNFSTASILRGLFGTVISAAIEVLTLMLIAGATNWIARRLGGVGTYAQLIYAFASFVAPLCLIGIIPTNIPIISIPRLVLYLYMPVLAVIAVKAVHHIGWGRAVASLLLASGIIVILGVAILTVTALFFPLNSGQSNSLDDFLHSWKAL
jgi:hypothetical protein